MTWVITGVVTSYVIAFVTCEHASLMGIKEGYYYGMFITCLTSFGLLLPVTIVILGIALYIMGK